MKFQKHFFHHTRFLCLRQEKCAAEHSAAQKGTAFFPLFHPERLAVGALIHGGICLVGTYQDSIQRAVVLRVTVVGALGNGAFDALVGMTAHNIPSFFSQSGTGKPERPCVRR